MFRAPFFRRNEKGVSALRATCSVAERRATGKRAGNYELRITNYECGMDAPRLGRVRPCLGVSRHPRGLDQPSRGVAHPFRGVAPPFRGMVRPFPGADDPFQGGDDPFQGGNARNPGRIRSANRRKWLSEKQLHRFPPPAARFDRRQGSHKGPRTANERASLVEQADLRDTGRHDLLPACGRSRPSTCPARLVPDGSSDDARCASLSSANVIISPKNR